MNRAAIVRLSLMGGLAAMLAVRMSCAGDRGWHTFARGVAGSSSGADGGSEERAAGQAPRVTGARLTALTGRLTDSEGRARTLAELRGTAFVTSLIYTRCTTVCPRTVAVLQRLERDAAGGTPPRFVLFSLDPAHDTPEVLRAFAATHALDSTRWMLLVPERGLLPPLASALGVAWRPGPDGGIQHSAIIAIVDSSGHVRQRRIGFADEPAKLLAAWRDVQ